LVLYICGCLFKVFGRNLTDFEKSKRSSGVLQLKFNSK
jgi:hypothetical protein